MIQNQNIHLWKVSYERRELRPYLVRQQQHEHILELQMYKYATHKAYSFQKGNDECAALIVYGTTGTFVQKAYSDKHPVKLHIKV